MTALSRPEQRLGLGGDSRWFGVHTAVVTDLVDPDGQGRVRVRFPWAPDGDAGALELWCRLATLMAGPGRGTWFVPEVDDEVLVCFEAGDPRRPFVIGSLWNGVDDPPQQMDGGGRNDVRAIHSRSGIRISMDDAAGSSTLLLETPAGQRITLADSAPGITVEDASGNRILVEAGGVTIDSVGVVSVKASTVDVSAGQMSVNAGIATFSGVVKAATVITEAVVSSSYTPGAGNIW